MKNKQAELVSQLKDEELYKALIQTQLLLLIISSFLGIWVFDDIQEFLLLFDFQDWSILLIGIPAGLLVVLYDLLSMRYLPERYFNDGGINQRIFSSLNGRQLVFIVLLVSISEELLFRGIIQTYVGLWMASLIFALIHIRYLYNVYLFVNILLLSFFIGFIYEWTGNLFVTIAMHFTIDLILGFIINKQAGKVKAVL
ncbi:CPBP family intramembrane metalloprotease [Pradoshia sp. D12]|uniref:CPBP family intramembrane glutamic endopeptidase n=1 Tax=Bacillaceae TaxID=186817 RepID=UPI00112A918E|nr:MULTISPECIES: CPBP family intramembrane glutamic endopeptidase [Bacillaceae]QFK71836.1 CPBP family intramembrane metalloprotease [Pradoshia sp. D12]TPF73631.1 CPBP family intramembrane metalloprotease [Bacillus sp. D12]